MEMSMRALNGYPNEDTILAFFNTKASMAVPRTVGVFEEFNVGGTTADLLVTSVATNDDISTITRHQKSRRLVQLFACAMMGSSSN
jgi:hypothetical protein